MADATAAALQRSNETFRRSGSSGLVWEDRFLPGDQPKPIHDASATNEDELRPGKEAASAAEGAGGLRVRTERRHRTDRSISPALDPPSPRVSVCGCCGFLGKPTTTSAAANKNRRRRL